jgi:predicted regulator of Ras-like GTPase activity (Roadblock/LC7/MglB family)
VASEAHWATVFALSAAQLDRLGLGRTVRVVALGEDGGVLVQGAAHPLVVSVAGRPGTNVGLALEALGPVITSLRPLQARAEALEAGAAGTE